MQITLEVSSFTCWQRQLILILFVKNSNYSEPYKTAYLPECRHLQNTVLHNSDSYKKLIFHEGVVSTKV